MGSVKDLQVLETPKEYRSGVGTFKFSNRYSVFDWGEMPDLIENKGRALATMAAFNFELINEEEDLWTHYVGLLRGEDDIVKFSDLENGSNGLDTMVVDLGVKYMPDPIKEGDDVVGYDYSFYSRRRGAINNYLIPLEVIFRRALPEGSSVFRKIEKAKKNENLDEREQELQKIYDSLGVKSEPKPGDSLPRTVVGYTTKLEPGDRNLTNEEAYKISGLTKKDFRKIEETTLAVEEIITKQAEKTGFTHYDGKIEFVWNNGMKVPFVVDVVGTLDENRFGFNGEQVSKQFLRKIYQTTQPDFEEACIEWKKTGPGWQERCPVKPKPLDPKVIKLTSQMYMAATNQYVGRNIFADVPPLEEVMDKLKAFR
ncbi:MAG: phosphoribosylaminoimidazolesuccinocarboxamide synthase [Candidatus Aenigmatarchaeota archaeon]